MYTVWTTADELQNNYPVVFEYEGVCEETGLEMYTLDTDVDICWLLDTDSTVVKYEVS